MNTHMNISKGVNASIGWESFFRLPADTLVPTSEPTLKYVRAEDKPIGGDTNAVEGWRD